MLITAEVRVGVAQLLSVVGCGGVPDAIFTHRFVEACMYNLVYK